VKANVYGTVATRFRDGGDEYDVLVRLREEDRRTGDDVYNTSIMSPMMSQVPLSNLASLQTTEGPITIERKKQERLVMVTADLKGRDLGSVTRDLRRELESLDVPEGFIVSIGGSAQEQMESFRWLGLALIGAVFLVYAVMASLFESLVDPFIIMFTFPLAVIGVAWMFFFSGTIFSIIAFIGVIMLAGIVVNNAIVMVDYINQLRDSGMELREAVVQGGRTRLRPVLMTALTTILAMTPLALGLGAGAEIRSYGKSRGRRPDSIHRAHSSSGSCIIHHIRESRGSEETAQGSEDRRTLDKWQRSKRLVEPVAVGEGFIPSRLIGWLSEAIGR
jgi:HAE1 family hydrophobic/amphiphilic exporter-1